MIRPIMLLIAALCCAGGAVAQQPYPAKALRMVVAYPPGGPNDIVGRTIGQKMSELLGHGVVIDNRAGAGGNIGTDLVAKAPPDGYLLLMGAGAMTIAPSIYPKLPYDVVQDFAPISLAATTAFVLIVHPAVPATTVKQLVDLARSRPGELNHGSAGLASPPHLSAELFKTMTGVKMVHVPYKGATPALADLLGGQIDLYFGGIASAVPHVRAKKLRALAVTSIRRSSALPDLPTLDEAGLKGFDISTWFGVLAPAGTPREIVSKLNEVIVKAAGMADIKHKLLVIGAEAEASTSEQFATHIKSEISKFAKIVKASGARFE